jgi:succinate dehydrogenase subunit B (EC 1.3.5.1)
MQLRLKIRREQDGKVWYQSFEVPYEEGMTFLSALQKIKEEQDETLSFRHFCRAGICGTCAIYINHFPKLACKEQVLPYVLSGQEVLIEPLKNFKVIRDLVVDHEVIPKKLKEFSLWVKGSQKEGPNRPSAEQEYRKLRRLYFVPCLSVLLPSDFRKCLRGSPLLCQVLQVPFGPKG